MLKSIIFAAFILSITFSCNTQKNKSEELEVEGQSKHQPVNKVPQDPDKFIITGHLIEKDFIIKNGVSAGYTELYLQASIQDYFIKFCESKVTKKELDPFLNKVVSVEVEIKNGNWDICPEDSQEMQSRVGPYVTIKALH